MTTGPAPYYSDDSVRLHLGDCLDILPELADNSVDAVVTDPPYNLSFMGAQWDSFGGQRNGGIRGGTGDKGILPGYGRGGTNADVVQFKQRGALAFQAWCQQWAAECLRILKPGGHLLAFGGTRTSHRLACAIEDAGFEIRDSIAWLYGSGFPKSHAVGKHIDRMLGATRETKTVPTWYGTAMAAWLVEGGGQANHHQADAYRSREKGSTVEISGDTPATPEAAQWQGWGTALKPAHEPIVVARKPLTGTVAANVLRWGTGALNIDAGRISHDESAGKPSTGMHGRAAGIMGRTVERHRETTAASTAGRWPANVVLDESQAAALDQMSGELTSGNLDRSKITAENGIYGKAPAERVGTYEANSGGASRFFLTVESDPFPPPVCVLHGMLSVCESANGAAAKPSTPSTARAAAQGSLQLPDEDSEDRSPEPASTAASSSPATDELTAAIARLNVPAKNAASLVRSAASAVNLCGSCVTAIVQSAVLTLQGLPGLSPLGLASTHNSSVAILNRNLALVAEDLAKCGTTSTTTDLTTSLGCAVDAISTYITRASRHGSNESDLSGPAIQQRMFYTAKADSNERITLPKPGAGDHRSGGNFAGGIRICNVCQNRTKPGNWLASDTRPWPACGHGDWQWGDPKPQEGRIAHPTVKPLSLMRWLVRLVTPPGGVILEPFAGSGTTVEAAMLEGFRCIAIEREADYLPLITQRINRRRDPIAYLTAAGDDLGLFG